MFLTRKHANNGQTIQSVLVFASLLVAIKEVLGDAANDEVIEAWGKAYGEIADFDGNITDGFTLNVETKCERLNNEYLIDLQQENSSSLPTSGSITTNISNGYYARLDYTITPNSATKKDTISYRLYYLGNGTPSLVGDLTYTLDGSEGRLIGPITKPFDIKY